jgi:DNA-binding CsgD family transcriptional regulator
MELAMKTSTRRHEKAAMRKDAAEQMRQLVDQFVLDVLDVLLRDGIRRLGRAMANAERVTPDDGSPESILAEVVGKHRLTPREADIVNAGIRGVPRRRLAKELGIGEETLKSHIQRILKKLGRHRFQEVAWELRERAMTGHRSGG